MLSDEEIKAVIKENFGNVDEYLGIAVTDRETGQIRLTKEKQKSLKQQCAKAGAPYFEVRTLEDLMTIEMQFFSPESMENTLTQLNAFMASNGDKE